MKFLYKLHGTAWGPLSCHDKFQTLPIKLIESIDVLMSAESDKLLNFAEKLL